MPQAISGDIRWRIVQANAEGQSVLQIARRFMVSKWSVRRWLANFVRYGDVMAPSEKPRGRPRKLGQDVEDVGFLCIIVHWNYLMAVSN